MWIAARDPRTPLAAKLLAGAVAAYAFSPIDLIPDFIPVLGLLDDLIIVPLGVWAVLQLIPPPLIAEFRAEAAEVANRPVSRKAARDHRSAVHAGCRLPRSSPGCVLS